MAEYLGKQQFEDLRMLAKLTDDEGNVDADGINPVLWGRLYKMEELVEFYDNSPNLTVKGYRLMIEYLEKPTTKSPITIREDFGYDEDDV